jgi:hypothetical protein
MLHSFGADNEQKVIATAVFLLAARRAGRSQQVRAGILLAIGIAMASSVIWMLGDVVQTARWDLSVGPIESLRRNFEWRPVFIMIPALSITAGAIVWNGWGRCGRPDASGAASQCVASEPLVEGAVYADVNELSEPLFSCQKRGDEVVGNGTLLGNAFRNTSASRPPRLRRCGGFASFS